ncbi:hypothetical protein [Clostridium cavendishii]|nr:hypothetical protein [Clostridium cavendishii]
MSTNDDFKKVENMLYNYKNTKIEIENMYLDLEILENDYKGIGAISYEEKTGPTNSFNSSVENEVVKRDEKILRLRKKIRLKEIEIIKINNVLEALNEKEKEFIKYKYFEKYTHSKISEVIYISFDYINEYRIKIINKISSYFQEEI